MNPVPAPERFLKLRPWAEQKEYGPPPGMTEEQVKTAPVLLDRSAPLTPDAEIGTAMRIYLELEDDEVELVRSGNAIVELTLWGKVLPPFQVQVYDREMSVQPGDSPSG